MKNYQKPILLLLCLIGLSGCKQKEGVLNIIPQPQHAEFLKGSFMLSQETRLYTNLQGEQREMLLAFLKESPLDLAIAEKEGNEQTINLLLMEPSEEFSKPESYHLAITPSQITISASSDAGLFYGVQSLLQTIDGTKEGEALPAMQIKDSPRFEYRGMHMDVSRHFRSKEFVLKQLDAMAYYKLNRLHWHLTDGAGWRIEIKKYPLLTEVAAWRPYSTWKEWWTADRKYCSKDDPKAQGGFYTQEEIKEVVAYATARHIIVIPEIEMPGHSEEVLAVYPQLSCSGKPYVDADFCIGNEQTFTFLQDVLTEVIALFPSQYIHIGGDEASKGGWRTCAKCAARMKAEKLKNVDELQSYLIHRMEEYLHSNGRKLLGWDEIMEGGLAPDATVMSWRGEEGGIAAARSGHQAIMTPGGYCYLDYSQDDPTVEPESIGGYLPLEKVYSYNPVPDSLTAAEQKLIMGVQANVWAEYITTNEHAEYMIYPRLLALAEVAWTAPERKSWPDFHRRALGAVQYLENQGYHPFPLHKERGEREVSLKSIKHLAVGKSVTYNAPYNKKYAAGGDSTLVDGIKGGWTYGDRRWQGFTNTDFDITIDLGAVVPIQSVSGEWMQSIGPWVWMPNEVAIEISTDGKEFSLLSRVPNEVPRDLEKLTFHDFGWKGEAKARYVRYVAHPNDIKDSWMFIDEIVIR